MEAQPVFETLNIVFSVIAGLVIVPIVAWLKKVIPSEWPIRAPIFALGLSTLAIWGLNEWLMLGLSQQDIIKYVLSTQLVTQLIDSSMGTVKKIKANGGET